MSLEWGPLSNKDSVMCFFLLSKELMSWSPDPRVWFPIRLELLVIMDCPPVPSPPAVEANTDFAKNKQN